MGGEHENRLFDKKYAAIMALTCAWDFDKTAEKGVLTIYIYILSGWPI